MVHQPPVIQRGQIVVIRAEGNGFFLFPAKAKRLKMAPLEKRFEFVWDSVKSFMRE